MSSPHGSDDCSPAAAKAALARLLDGRSGRLPRPDHQFDGGNHLTREVADAAADDLGRRADDGVDGDPDGADGCFDDADATPTRTPAALTRRLAAADGVESLAGLFDAAGEAQLRRAVDVAADGDEVDAERLARAGEALRAVDEIRAVADEGGAGRVADEEGAGRVADEDGPEPVATDDGAREGATDHFRSGHTTGINADGEPRDE